MTGRPSSGQLGRSPFEIVATYLVAGVLIGVGMIWAMGVLIGSILGSTLPGSPGEGIAAMIRSFPDIGAAWEPRIPNIVVWIATVVVVGLLAPLLWKLARIGGLRDEGAHWATSSTLRRAGLLVADGVAAHSVPETPASEGQHHAA